MLPTRDLYLTSNTKQLRFTNINFTNSLTLLVFSTSPVYKILDKYLSKQQLKNGHDAQKRLLVKDEGMFQLEGEYVQHTCASQGEAQFSTKV